MNVQIDIHQERSVVVGPLYRISTQTVYSYGISPDIFVHDVETDSFSHVATVWDIINVRDNKTLAENNLEPYYRKASAVVDYSDQTTATDAAEYTVGRVESLALLYDQMNTDFVGSDNYSFVEP
jgi:hypothetical protein